MNTSSGNISDFSDYTLLTIQCTTVMFTFLVFIPINCCVICLIIRGTERGLILEFFTLNLTMSNVIMGLSIPLYPVYWFVSPEAMRGATGFFNVFAITIRPLFQCCICLEHYLAVLHPLTFLRFRPLRYRVACAAAIWLSVLSTGMTGVFHTYSDVFITAIVGLPLFTVKLFCCLSVLRALKQPGPGRERDGDDQVKMRAFKIMCVILVSELIMYSPLIPLVSMNSCMTSSVLIHTSSSYFIIVELMDLIQPLLYLQRVGKLPRVGF